MSAPTNSNSFDVFESSKADEKANTLLPPQHSEEIFRSEGVNDDGMLGFKGADVSETTALEDSSTQNLHHSSHPYLHPYSLAYQKNTRFLSKHLSCSAFKGFHIFLLSLLAAPITFLLSGFLSFYYSFLLVFNIYDYYIEGERSSLSRYTFTLALYLLLFPIISLIFFLCLGIYSAVKQISWCLSSWSKEICDFEKGFYGKVCAAISLPHCCPYDIALQQECRKFNPQASLRFKPAEKFP